MVDMTDVSLMASHTSLVGKLLGAAQCLLWVCGSTQSTTPPFAYSAGPGDLDEVQLPGKLKVIFDLIKSLGAEAGRVTQSMTETSSGRLCFDQS